MEGKLRMEERVKSLNESIITIRVLLQNAGLKKSGKNKFAGFEYFELSDFLPKLNELMLEEGINDLFTIYTNANGSNTASLLLIKGEEKQEYNMPFKLFATPLNKNGLPSMQDIQYLGALNTYYKRYLYLNAFGITDGDVIDSMGEAEVTTKEAAEQYIITFGKYNGKTMKEVCEDSKYTNWLLYNEKTDQVIKDCITLITGQKELSEAEQKEVLDLMQKVSNLLEETNTDRKKFYNYYKVDSNAEMSLEQLKDAVNQLEKKVK